jgi:hypothetical protein
MCFLIWLNFHEISWGNFEKLRLKMVVTVSLEISKIYPVARVPVPLTVIFKTCFIHFWFTGFVGTSFLKLRCLRSLLLGITLFVCFVIDPSLILSLPQNKHFTTIDFKNHKQQLC